MTIVRRNSEILFIYDAKMTNPNGDMDNENKPRMDYDTDTNLVSDVRLKRYIRDYYESVKEEEIFVTNKAENAKQRGEQLKKSNKTHIDLIDVRLFGAVFAESGGSDHITGPVQFNWGYSLNPVEINESSTITSSFSSGEGVGKDFRVRYSVIAFNGSINALVAKDSNLTESDVQTFDKAMIESIPYARTRSKIGQYPRIYLRIELEDKQLLKDLREFVSIDYKSENKYLVRSIDDFTFDFTRLAEYLKDKPISNIYYWKDDSASINGWDEIKNNFKDKLKRI